MQGRRSPAIASPPRSPCQPSWQQRGLVRQSRSVAPLFVVRLWRAGLVLHNAPFLEPLPASTGDSNRSRGTGPATQGQQGSQFYPFSQVKERGGPFSGSLSPRLSIGSFLSRGVAGDPAIFAALQHPLSLALELADSLPRYA